MGENGVTRQVSESVSSYLLRPLRSEAEIRRQAELLSVARAWRKIIWRQTARDEDERLDRLVAVCTRLCDGDLGAGKRLATSAIWSVG